MDYNARYYSPYLNRFVSPDTIIPDPADPQSWNRYAYVKNNPLKYVDPSGHCFVAFGADTALCAVVVAAVAPVVVEATLATVSIAVTAYAAYEIGQNLDTSTPPFPLDTPAEGLTESFPLPPPDPGVYNPGPTLGGEFTGQLQFPGPELGESPFPTIEGVPLDSGSEFAPFMEARGNKLSPDPNATGPHSVFKRDPVTGEVSGYETYVPQTNPNNPAPWQSTKRFDATGKPHYNKRTKQYVDTPHVHDPDATGGVRKPEPDEIP